MKLYSRLTAATAILLCLACAAIKPPVTVSATGFAKFDPKANVSLGRSTALKVAEARARQQIEESMHAYRVGGDQSLQQLLTVDPFVRAVFDDTLRSARVSDRTVRDDGSVSVQVELDLDRLSKMLGKQVTQ